MVPEPDEEPDEEPDGVCIVGESDGESVGESDGLSVWESDDSLGVRMKGKFYTSLLFAGGESTICSWTQPYPSDRAESSVTVDENEPGHSPPQRRPCTLS